VLLAGDAVPRYLPSGHLTFLHQGTLMAAPFSVDRLELTGHSDAGGPTCGRVQRVRYRAPDVCGCHSRPGSQTRVGQSAGTDRRHLRARQELRQPEGLP
jgi:hypothetical protein